MAIWSIDDISNLSERHVHVVQRDRQDSLVMVSLSGSEWNNEPPGNSAWLPKGLGTGSTTAFWRSTIGACQSSSSVRGTTTKPITTG